MRFDPTDRLEALESDLERLKADLRKYADSHPCAPQPVWSGGRYQGIIVAPGSCLHEGVDDA